MGLLSRQRVVPFQEALQQMLEELTSGYMQYFDNKLVCDMDTEQLLQYLPAAKRGMGIYLMWSVDHAEPGDAMPDRLKAWMHKTGVELFVIEHRLGSDGQDTLPAFEAEVCQLIGVLAGLLNQTTDDLRATLQDKIQHTLTAFGYAFEGGW